MDDPLTPSSASFDSSFSTWSALCKDCQNLALSLSLTGGKNKQQKDDLRQETYEYSDVHAIRQLEHGQSRSDRCPECRKRHKREIAAFPVAYIDIRAIGEAASYVIDPNIGPTGPLGGLGPLPVSHSRRTESVDLRSFALGLTDQDILELLEKMSANDVVILEAGTGTGKSTLAPFRLMNPPKGSPYRPTDIGPIVVTEPRVPATTEVAKFVGEAMCFGHDPEKCTSHIGPGYPVGYQCEGKKVWDEACSLVYVTDGTMVNWITNGDLARIGTVIIDEAHERSANIDLILTMLAAKLPRYPHLKVVIASATIDKTYFTRFFEQTPTIRVGHHYVAAAKSIGYGVPLFLDIDFTQEVLEDGFTATDATNPSDEGAFKLSGWPDSPNSDEAGASLRTITRDTFLDIRSPAPEWPKNVGQAAVKQALKILEVTTHGDILVFLPSESMVRTAQRELIEHLDDLDLAETIDVYWLMRATDKAEKILALSECPPGKRKIVVASNLAETSLTIAGIQYVVDSGLVIQAKWDPGLAVSYAPLVPHSQSGIRQRWGRVGRKTHGWVFPLYSLAQYFAMPRDTPAGSTQTNLEASMLKLLAAGEDPAAVVYPADFVADGVNRDSYAQESADGFTLERGRALDALRKNGAVSIDGTRLTRLGSELARSRLPPEQAIALMFADRLACVPEVATALIALGGREGETRNRGHLVGPDRLLAGSPDWPTEWNLQARRCHEALAIGCVDDLDLVVRIFSLWASASDPSRWCDQWWVNEDALVDVSDAAAKLIESLAPGMSEEAKRPLDQRLTLRARAVFTRALASLRFGRTDDNLWHSTNPNQPDPVAVSPFHLVPPANEVVALVRERPNDFTAGIRVGHGRILGLVAVLEWAARGDPTDFELMRRVREHRHDDAAIHQDPMSTLRQSFPIGSSLQVVPSQSDGAALPAIRKLTDGLAKPESTRDYSVQVTGSDDDPIAYSTETSSKPSNKSSRSDRDDPPIAGMEIPEEELRLTPISIIELENPDLEDFSQDEHSEPSRLDVVTPLPESPEIVISGDGLDLHRVSPWIATVTGYATGRGQFQLIVEPFNDSGVANSQIGREFTARAVSVAVTHFEVVNVLRECDDAGVLTPTAPLHVSGSLIDDDISHDAGAIENGSMWKGQVVAGIRKHERSRISLIECAVTKVEAASMQVGRREAGTVASTLAILTGERYENWQKREYWIARLVLANTGFSPRVAVPRNVLERAGVAPIQGAPVCLELSRNLYARRSGSWGTEDVEALINEYPNLFANAKKNTNIRLIQAGPLSNEALAILLDVDPTNEIYERNAWLLWESSRRLGVKRAIGVGEARLSPEDARSLLASTNLTSLRRQHSVGIKVTESGKISVTGNAADVAAALDELGAATTEARAAIQFPARPDGKFPKFPPNANIMSAVRVLGNEFAELFKGYNAPSGELSLATSVGSHVQSAVESLGGQFSYYATELAFADEKGFSIFHSKARWDELSAGLPTVARWIVEGGKSWGIFAGDLATCSTLLERIKSGLARVAFTSSEIQIHRPVVVALDPVAAEFAVDFISPATPVTDARDDDEADQGSSSIEDSAGSTRRTIAGPAGQIKSFMSRIFRRPADGITDPIIGDTTRSGNGTLIDEGPTLPSSTILQHKDSCIVSDLHNGQYRVTGPDAVFVDVAASDYRRDARPLHWLREGDR